MAPSAALKRSRTTYGSWAAIYDALASFYSFGAINRAKCWHLDCLAPGSRALYAGSGTAQESLAAARRGVVVTLLDSSPHMLARARQAFAQADLPATFLCRTLEEHTRSHPPEQYDAVTAHFFLNVFASHELETSVDHLAHLVGPGGRLFVADFAAPSRTLWLRLLQQFYYLLPLALFALLANNPWHQLYDYGPVLARRGLRRIAHQSVRALGLPLYEASCFEWSANK